MSTFWGSVHRELGVLHLHQHTNGIFQITRQRLHKLRCLRSVADAVVNGDGGFHAIADKLGLI